MRYKADDNKEEGDPILQKEDPLLQLPEKLQELVMNQTHDLTIFLGRRTEFFKKQTSAFNNQGIDYSTCALLERLAFYETMISSLVEVTKRLEERLGGVEGSEHN